MDLQEHHAKWAAIEQALLPLVQDDEQAVDVYRAFCNVVWVPIDHPGHAYDDVPHGEGYSCTWRYAGGMVADWRDRGEDYLDFYCSGNEGSVSAAVRAAMAVIGLRPVT